MVLIEVARCVNVVLAFMSAPRHKGMVHDTYGRSIVMLVGVLHDELNAGNQYAKNCLGAPL